GVRSSHALALRAGRRLVRHVPGREDRALRARHPIHGRWVRNGFRRPGQGLAHRSGCGERDRALAISVREADGRGRDRDGRGAGVHRLRWRYRSAKPMVAGVTATAGGLVFTGELTGDFLALDAET